MKTLTVTITRGSLSPRGELWEVADYTEVGALAPWPTTGNFSALTLYPIPKFGTGGQSCWVELERAEIDFIKAINQASVKGYGWAVQELDESAGEPYRAISGYPIDDRVRWLRVALASCATQPRNLFSVIGWSPDRAFARVEGIPHSADYGRYASCRWLIHNVYVVYPDRHTGDVPQYRVPLWDPSSGFKTDVGGGDLWVDARWLRKRLA